jgi:zinc/manganese transport system substrate-binding protein
MSRPGPAVTPRPRAGRRAGLAAAAVCATLMLAACSTSRPATSATAGATAAGRPITVVATINAWGSIAAQLGGTRVQETSIITNPATDPHAYEPTPTDARMVAGADVFIQNGIGYDSWAAKMLAANPVPGRSVLDVGGLVSIAVGGNPHRWYSPPDVRAVVDQITADYAKTDPADKAYFEQRKSAFLTTDLANYNDLIAAIRAKYSGVKVGASESIFSPMAQALGLDLVTPASFLTAISQGTDVSAADKATIDAQISGKQIKVYVFNSQNSTPDVAAQVTEAKNEAIPVVAVTETLSPAGATFQQWQCAQLQQLAAALHQATGR